MGTKTIRTCDVTACGRVVEDREDGIVLRGVLIDATHNKPVFENYLLAATPEQEVVICWNCFDLHVRPPTVVHRPPLKTLPRRTPDPPPPRDDREYEDTRYHARDDYRPHGGATGPLPPPELPATTPRAIRVVRRLSGVTPR